MTDHANHDRCDPDARTDDLDSDPADQDQPLASAGQFLIMGHKVGAPRLEAGLYIVATPIGNLRDMTIRGLETLAACDLVACEDTRVSRKLLSHYGIRTRLVTYHEHNADKQRPYLLEALGQGKAVALISDAGTPLLSDPGYRLVSDMLEAGHAVVPVPGASAMLTALVGAGLPTDQLHFAGFLPTKAGARNRKLSELAAIPGTLIFYESPRRLGPVLAAMRDALGGERDAVVARELTKRFEDFHRGTLAQLATHYDSADAPKGEAVILIGPGQVDAPDEQDVDDMIREGLALGMHVKQLSADIAVRVGAKKNDIYKRAQSLKDDLDQEDLDQEDLDQEDLDHEEQGR